MGFVSAQSFQVPITVTDGNASAELSIGMDGAALDGFDAQDSLAAPAPPAGNFDARIIGTDNEYIRDIRLGTQNVTEYELSYACCFRSGPNCIELGLCTACDAW